MADDEVICVDDEAPPPREAQGCLPSLWRQIGEVGVSPFKRRKVCEPPTPPIHTQLDSILASRGGETSSRAFYESLEQAKELRMQEAAAHSAADQSAHERKLREKTGKLTPPE